MFGACSLSGKMDTTFDDPRLSWCVCGIISEITPVSHLSHETRDTKDLLESNFLQGKMVIQFCTIERRKTRRIDFIPGMKISSVYRN